MKYKLDDSVTVTRTITWAGDILAEPGDRLTIQRVREDVPKPYVIGPDRSGGSIWVKEDELSSI